MTLTFKLDRYVLPLELYAKIIQVCVSFRSAMRVVLTDTHKHRHNILTDHVKTITPVMSQMWGVNMYDTDILNRSSLWYLVSFETMLRVPRCVHGL